MEEFSIPKEAQKRNYEAIPDPPMGEQIQADFGFVTVRNKVGKPVKLMFIVFVLAHSRESLRKFYMIKIVYW